MQVFRANIELQDASIPPQELVECVTSCRNQFETLRGKVLKLAESFAVPTPIPEEIFSFVALESLLQDVTKAQKKAEGQQQALKVLRSVLANPSDRIDFLHELNTQGLDYLIWQLIGKDRLGLAFRLARYLEIHSPDNRPRLPSWLLRAVFVGRHMRYDVNGEMAKILTDTGDNCFVDGLCEWNQAVSLLLAAAALRPALLAPTTEVLAALHSLQLGEGLGQLSEYCQTIATYGSQLQSLDALAFSKLKEQSAWQQALDDLHHRVEDWYCEATKKTTTYVWRNWLEPGGLVHSLLLPVNQNDSTRLEAVKQQVKRLSDDAEIEREVDYTNQILLSRYGNAIQLNTFDEISQHLREAVEFGHCWINLQEHHPSYSNYYQQQAIQLKQLVSSRQNAVLKELNSFEKKNSSVLVLAGIHCCRTAVKDFQGAFRSRRFVSKGSRTSPNSKLFVS